MNKKELTTMLTTKPLNFALLTNENFYKIGGYKEGFIFDLKTKKTIGKITDKTFYDIDIKKFYELRTFYKRGLGLRLFVYTPNNKNIFKGAK
jgi:hypothetical protein